MAEFISVPLKKPSDVDIIRPLQNVIKSNLVAVNQKDYSESITELSKLRKNALWRAFEKYESSLEVMYRYYDQINVLESKIQINELQIPFKWKDAFDRTIFGGKLSLTISSLAYEKACVLFNIAALQSSVAATQSLESDEGLKLAAKLFQQAAGAFSHLKHNIMLAIQQEPTPDMSPETLEALAFVMISQAQEIFMYKAIHDNMKGSVIAKLATQTAELYNETAKLFQKEIFRAFWDKEWVPLITGKQVGYRAMAEYFQALVCRNEKRIGEEIARLEYAVDMFKTAAAKSAKLSIFDDYCNKAAKNLAEIKKDNDFIYHERIPDYKSLPSISKALVAKFLPLPEKFSSNFHDLFAELLPTSVHRAVSTFENQKTEVVNTEIAKLRNLRQILNGTLASLNLPAAIEDVSGTQIPQSLMDKASSVAKSGGLQQLEKMMNELPELLQRNNDILDEAEKMLNEEQSSDEHLRTQFKDKWTRAASSKINEQFKLNCQKYHGIIDNAINADKVVREKFEQHREGMNILSMQPEVLVNYIPTGSGLQESRTVLELRQLMENVETLKNEQDVIECELQSSRVDIQAVFLSALARDGIINENSIIAENISVHYGPLQKQVRESAQKQEKLIAAIQAKHSEFSREQLSSGSTREQMLCRLAAAYDQFKELENNLTEGVKFYNDLTQLLVVFQNKISDFCFARKTEKEELLKDLTSNLSQSKPAAPPSMTTDNPGMNPQPQMSSQILPNLPYPVQTQYNMPMPYGSGSMTLPHYMHLPLPATYNPYATLPYPPQGGYMQPPNPQMPHGGYSAPP